MPQETLSIFLFDENDKIFSEWKKFHVFEQTLVDNDRYNEKYIQESINANIKQFFTFFGDAIKQKILETNDRNQLNEYLKKHGYHEFNVKPSLTDAYIEAEDFTLYEIELKMENTEKVYTRLLAWHLRYAYYRLWRDTIIVFVAEYKPKPWVG